MQKYFQIVVNRQLIHPKIGTNWLTEVKMHHVNDFYRVEQLHLLKLKAFLNFESSTHSVVKWPVEFGFIVGSHYVQVYPLANQIILYFHPQVFLCMLCFTPSHTSTKQNLSF